MRLGENTQFVTVYGTWAFYYQGTNPGTSTDLALYSYDLRTGARQVVASPIDFAFRNLAESADHRYLVARTGYESGPLLLVDLGTRAVCRSCRTSRIRISRGAATTVVW